MQEIYSSNPLVVTGICDPNKSQARNHRSLKLGLKLEYLYKNKRIKKEKEKIYMEQGKEIKKET